MNINLTTERLNLRPVSENDIENIFELQSLEQTAKFNTSNVPSDINETEVKVAEWIEENNKENIKHFTFAVELIDKKNLLD